METPLPSLIKQFRKICPKVYNVEDAANKFLSFLNEFGRSSHNDVKQRSMESIIIPVFDELHNLFNEKFQEWIVNKGREIKDFHPIFESILNDQIELFLRIFRNCEPASFVGITKPVSITNDKLDRIREIATQRIPITSSAQVEKVIEIAILSLQKNILSKGRTGFVIAGFGDEEIFPTLISFEIDGLICDSLKYVRTNCVDIDRQGTKAKVLPFAQKEMVERFLYGLDDKIQNDITNFCRTTIPDIRTGIINEIAFQDERDREEIMKRSQNAESAFLDGLKEKAFEKIRAGSQIEIEDMVEFMPKPELAKMAEALVNLTSIKRRVSRGVETVGGPIDVAVISQAEGFVWVKRKHYFPPELNVRHFERRRGGEKDRQEETSDGKASKSRVSNTRARAKTKT